METEAFGTRYIAQRMYTYAKGGGRNLFSRLENKIMIVPTWIFHVHGQLLPFPPSLTKFSEIPDIFDVSKVFPMSTVYSI